LSSVRAQASLALGGGAGNRRRHCNCVDPYEVSSASLSGLGSFHVPIVPMSVRAPVAASMLYIETLFEAEFVT
jgi:hypothetical protein